MEKQDIYLDSSEDGDSFALTNTNIQVHLADRHAPSRDSSLVKSTSLVEYRWETNACRGNLVAVSREGAFVAYILHGNQSRAGSAVRVYHKPSKQRGLIKRMEGQPTDIAWAYSMRPLYLGIVDEGGNLYVHQINLGKQELTIQKFFHMRRPDSSPGVQYRLIFCPFMIDDSIGSPAGAISKKSANGDTSAASDSDVVSAPDSILRSYGLMAISHGSTVDVLDLDALIENHGRDLSIDTCRYGMASIHAKGEVLAMAMSPDATALAVAGDLGEVTFYIMESLDNISEAHQWTPHGGKPVTSIHFLDDITVMDKGTHFWKYALTASNDNRELKIFDCEKWNCINTLRIGVDKDAPENIHQNPIILAVDWTAGFILMSDIDRKSLYVVQISQDEFSAKFVSFSEFPLVQPALSLAVVEAAMKRFRPFSPETAFEFGDKEYVGEEEHGKVTGVRVLLYAVNPRSLLELEIRYQPKIVYSGVDNQFGSSTSSTHSDAFQDRLSDISSSPICISMPSTDEKVINLDATKEAEVNSPTDSSTPVDEKSEEIVVERRHIHSPDSEEVRNILLNNVRDSQLIENFADLDQSSTAAAAAAISSIERSESHPEMSERHALSATIQQQAVVNHLQPNQNFDSYPSSEIVDSMGQLREQMEKMMETMKLQELEIRSMKNSLVNQSDILRNVSEIMLTAEQQMKITNKVMVEVQNQNRSFDTDAIRESITRAIVHAVRQNLDACVRQEIQTSIASVLHDLTPRLEQLLQRDLARLAQEAESGLRQTFGQLTTSPTVLTALGDACGKAAGDQALGAFKHAFSTSVVPSFEKVVSGAFGQLNDLFRQGTAEYVEQLQRQTSAQKSETEQSRSALNVVVEQLKAMLSDQKLAHRKMDQTVREVIRDETKRVFTESQLQLSDVLVKAVRSQAVTPEVSSAVSPQVIDRQSLQKEVAALIHKQCYAEAFQRALNALDLNLVLFACGKVSPADLFAVTPCPLPQPVILSLIQQLSNDLSSQTDLKLKYLMEAVTSIDSKPHSVQHQNVNRVISQLERKLEMFSKESSSGPFMRQIKLLAMAAQSLTK